MTIDEILISVTLPHLLLLSGLIILDIIIQIMINKIEDEEMKNT